MPFARRSFGTGRPSLVKPSSAAMQQFRGGSPSVAPVPLRMPARPPVANRMQQYNTPPMQPGGGRSPLTQQQLPETEYRPYIGEGDDRRYTGMNPNLAPPMQPGGGRSPLTQQQLPEGLPPGGNGLPGGLDPRAIAADPAGFAKWKQGAQAQEARMPGSTMLGQPGRGPSGTYDGPGSGGGIGMMTPNNPNDGMSLGSDWANPAVMPDEPMLPGGGEERQPYNPTPMPKPVMTEAPSGLASFLQYQNSKPGGGVGMSMPHNPNSGMQIGAGGIGDEGRTQDYKRGGQVQAYAKGGRVMAKPVAKKAVKAAAPAKTASRGDGIAQRGRTKGTMR